MKRQYYIMLALVLGATLAKSQSLPDWVLELGRGDSLFQRLIQHHSIDLSWLETDTVVQRFNQALRKGDEKHPSKRRTELTYNGYYFSGSQAIDSSSHQRNSLYSSVGLSKQVQIFLAPIQVFGIAVLQNQLLDRQLSDFSISFDKNGFLDRMKQNWISSWRMTSHFPHNTMPQIPGSLSVEEAESLAKEVKYRTYKSILSHPSYWMVKDSLERIGNSVLLGNEDKPKSEEIDLAVKTAKQKLDLLNQMEASYRELWEYKCLYNDRYLKEGLAKCQIIEKLAQSWADAKSWLDPGLSPYLRLSGVEKIMLQTEDFSIGQFVVPGSDYTLYQMPLQGVHVAWEGRLWSLEVAQGRQRFQLGFSPSYGRLLFNPRPNKNFSYAKLGLGKQEGSIAYVTVLRSAERISATDTLAYLPKTNLVWELSGNLRLSPRMGVEVSGALAQIYSSGLGETKGFPFSSDQGAYKMSLVFLPKAEGFRLAAGYFRTGAGFISFGNPFLYNNWQGASVEGNLSLLNQRLSIRGSFKWGRVLKSELQGGGYFETQYFGNAILKVGKAGLLSASFLPNLFQQASSGQEKIEGGQSLFQLQYNQLLPLGKAGDQWSGTASFSNYRFNYQLFDTLQTGDGFYGAFQQAFMWTNGSTLSGLFSFSNQETNWLEDWMWHFEFGKQFKKLEIEGGVELLKQRGFDTNRWGLTCGASSVRGHVFNVGFQLVYRRPFSGSEPAELLGNFQTSFTF